MSTTDRHHHTPIPTYPHLTPAEAAIKRTGYRDGVDAERARWLAWLEGQRGSLTYDPVAALPRRRRSVSRVAS